MSDCNVSSPVMVNMKLPLVV